MKQLVLFAASTALLMPTSAFALQRAEPIADLAAASVSVARGHVESRAAGIDPGDGLVYTYTRITVDETLAGVALPPVIVLKQPGGVVGTTLMVFTGMTGQLPGDEVVLFLDARRRDGTLYPIGRHGVGYVERDAGRVEVAYPLGGGVERLPYGAVAELGRTARSRTQRAVQAIVPIPPESPPFPPASHQRPLADMRGDAAASSVRWRVKDGYQYLSAGVFGWPFVEAAFGRWWPLDREVEIYMTSTGRDYQYGFGEDATNLDLAVAAWLGESARAAKRLRLIRGTARPHAECNGSFAEDGTISVTYKNECLEMGDGDPAFALAGFVADLGASDTVRVNSKFQGPLLDFARIRWGVVHLNRGEQLYAGRAINDYWHAGWVCQRQVIVHMLGHAFGLGDSLLAGQHPDSKTPAGANIMDATFHSLEALPQMSLECGTASGEVGRTAPGGADLRALDRMLRKPR